MSWFDIKQQVDELSNAWENFKDNNEQKLKVLEKKKNGDCIIEEQFNRLNNELDRCKERIDKEVLREKRPGFLQTTISVERKNFINYIRYGNDVGSAFSIKDAYNSISKGGYLPAELYQGIKERTLMISPIRKLASQVQISTSDTFDYIRNDSNEEAKWIDESTAGKNLTQYELNKYSIKAHPLYSQPSIAQNLVNDLNFDIEAWIIDAVANNFAKTENNAFITGDGQGKPFGLINNLANTQKVMTDAIILDDILNLYYMVKPKFRDEDNAFIMYPETIKDVRCLKDGGRYIWQPGATNPDILLGAPLYASNDLDPKISSNFVAIYGNFKKAYQIVDRSNIEVIRDPYTNKPFINLYTTKRVGGDVMDFEAYSLLMHKTSST
ncbi:putative Phage major capsid protein [Candidatus Xenohaliotis californiensis]|uniref:Phage major capsid protein n=1 Tax=Candidatus Xenohaliotis californiensis TaxID=84677 RepID=A0ABP0ETS0_9RICK|nr:putative Phage major capsid protein [Candidatus Xenohaliotis californiensis]